MSSSDKRLFRLFFALFWLFCRSLPSCRMRGPTLWPVPSMSKDTVISFVLEAPVNVLCVCCSVSSGCDVLRSGLIMLYSTYPLDGL